MFITQLYTLHHAIFRQIYWARELLEKWGNLGEIRREFRKQEDWVQRPLETVRSTCYAGREKGLDGCFFERVLPAKGLKEFSFKN